MDENSKDTKDTKDVKDVMDLTVGETLTLLFEAAPHLFQIDLDDAIKKYEKALQIDPNDVNIRFNLGTAFHAKGWKEKAIKEYKKVLKIIPNHAMAHCYLGRSLQAYGSRGKAIKEYQEALRINPELSLAHIGLGSAFMNNWLSSNNVRRDKLLIDEAIKEYQEALRIAPEYADAHGKLGIVLQAKGQIEEAIKEYRKALKIDPGRVFPSDIPIKYFFEPYKKERKKIDKLILTCYYFKWRIGTGKGYNSIYFEKDGIRLKRIKKDKIIEVKDFPLSDINHIEMYIKWWTHFFASGNVADPGYEIPHIKFKLNINKTKKIYSNIINTINHECTFIYHDGTSDIIKYKGMESHILPRENPYQKIYEVNKFRVKVAQGLYNFFTNNYISKKLISLSVIGKGGTPLSKYISGVHPKAVKQSMQMMMIFGGADGSVRIENPSNKTKPLPSWVLDSLSRKIAITIQRGNGSINVI